MTLHYIAEASGYLGATLGVAMVVPQIVRTYRNRALPGVSAISWSLTALSCFTWLLYGVRAAEPPQIPGNVLLVTGAVLVVLAVPSKTSVNGRALGLAGGGAALTALAFLIPPALVGMVGLGIGLVSGLPQLVVSLTRRSPDSAVSLLAWALRIACQASWLTYALLIGDVVVVVSASVLLANAAAVLASELMSRRPARADAGMGPAGADLVPDPPADTYRHRRQDARLPGVESSSGTLPSGNERNAKRSIPISRLVESPVSVGRTDQVRSVIDTG